MDFKKCIFPLMLALILVLSLCGCGTTPAEEKKDNNSEVTTEDVSSAPVASEAAIGTETEHGVEKTDRHSEENRESMDGIRISFDYSRMSTHASNQIAIWVEDKEGNLVKTLLVTDFTAGRRGYRNRDMALSAWVEAADPESRTDEEIDAISSATPIAGSLTYSWDMTDESGVRVPEGCYMVKLEGTLFWESNVLYSAVFDTATAEKELEITELRSEQDNPENEGMIQNVRMEVLRGGD